MFKTQQFELMALVALILLSKSLLTSADTAEVEASSGQTASQVAALGERKAMIELSANGYSFAGKRYTESELPQLVAALQAEGVTKLGLHSSDPLLRRLQQLNHAAYDIGAKISI